MAKKETELDATKGKNTDKKSSQKKMAAKKQEKVVLQNTPVEAIKWLKQPTALTFLRGDLSLAKVGTIVEMVDVIQDRIDAVLSGQRKTLFDQYDVDENGLINIDVPLNSLTNLPNKYGEVIEIARELRKLGVDEIITNEKGEQQLRTKNIFESITVPLRESGRRQGFIRFSLFMNSIDTLFRLDQYNKYIKSITRTCRSAATSRIYMFITAHKFHGGWTVGYNDLRLILGCTIQEIDEKTKKVVYKDVKYELYRDFKRRILKAAEDELKELVEQGSVDCYFDFKEAYPKGKKCGTPEKIVFTIHTTKLGEMEEDKSAFVQRKYTLPGILSNAFGLTLSDSRQIMSRVTETNIDILFDKIEEVKDYIAKHPNIESVKKYAIAALRNMLDDVNAAENDDTYEEVTENNDNVVEEKPSVVIADNGLERFEALKEQMKAEGCDPEGFFDAFNLYSEDEDSIVIEVPSQSFLETYQQAHGNEFYDRLAKLTGKEIKIKKLL